MPTRRRDLTSGRAHRPGPQAGLRLREMAGYRNRLVHFYDQVTLPELYRICTEDLGDVDVTLTAILDWIAKIAVQQQDSGAERP